MHRLLALAKGCLVLGGLLAVGCAHPEAVQSSEALRFEAAAAHVDAGPLPCTVLQARIGRSEAWYASQPGTWLDSPIRMVQSRRLRALQARAKSLGCALPQI